MKPFIQPFLQKQETRIARISTIIIFLALIRTLIEPLRVHLSPDQLQPLLAGSILSALSCMTMTILHFYSKYRYIIAIAILTFLGLLMIKSLYMN